MTAKQTAQQVVEQLRRAGCVFAEDEAALLMAAAQSPDELDRLLSRRMAGEPLELMLGWAEFAGLRIAVAPGVFVPRRRTVTMVNCALARVRAGMLVVDLCCGSAAIGAAVASRRDVRLVAADIDPAATAIARRNVAPFDGQVFLGDLYSALPDELRGQVDLMLVNAPYVPSAAIALMPPEARDHEARVALDGGPDGLQIQRRVVADVLSWLAPAGYLLIESSRAQAAATAGLMTAIGLTTSVETDDERDGTVVIGTR